MLVACKVMVSNINQRTGNENPSPTTTKLNKDLSDLELDYIENSGRSEELQIGNLKKEQLHLNTSRYVNLAIKIKFLKNI